MQNNFSPFSINLKNKNILILGAGNIAFHKCEVLRELKANIKVVTKEVADPRFLDLKDIQIEIREFLEKDLEDIFLVVAATDNKDFNRNIFELCEKKNILINNITSKEDMNLRFMSVIKNSEYTLGISANGNPKKAKTLKEKIIDFLKI